MSEPISLSLDLETLGLRENTVVLSLGVAAFRLDAESTNDFDRYIETGFHVKFSVKDQMQTWNRSTDASTIEWWKKQDKEAQKIVKPSVEDVTMADGLAMFTDWVKSIDYRWGKSYTWTRGLAFDIPKVEHMYYQAGMKLPFNSWMARDTRTFIDILTGVSNGQYEPDGGFPKNFLKHDALHDAAMDAYRMTEIFQKAL